MFPPPVLTSSGSKGKQLNGSLSQLATLAPPHFWVYELFNAYRNDIRSIGQV